MNRKLLTEVSKLEQLDRKDEAYLLMKDHLTRQEGEAVVREALLPLVDADPHGTMEILRDVYMESSHPEAHGCVH
jgi:hypothetical protein